MKKILLTLVALIAVINISAAEFKSPSINGATGLISTPTAKTGWEDAVMGLDFTMHYVGDDGNDTYVPAFSLQLFNQWELGAAWDLQGENGGDDIIFHSKFNFYNTNSSALAIGGNWQSIRWVDEGDSDTYYQIYLAATYSGDFFNMPSQTTIVFGKTMGDNASDDNFDFSMGFDLDFFPSVFKGYVHWINDFANYSYSVNPKGSNSGSRACFNTGIRIGVFRKKQYKLNIDAVMTDVLDANRSWSLGAAFGLSL